MGFLVALQFLTAVPAFIHREPRPEELGRSMAYYSLVGFLLGLVLASIDWGLSQLVPAPLVAGLLVLLWVLSTGGLHLDGLMDVCDGVFSQSTPARRLEVMKDVRMGAYGAIGGICIILVKFAALLSLPPGARLAALVLAPTLSRAAMVLAAWLFPLARPDGLAALVKASLGWPQLFISSALALVGCYLFGGLAGVAVLAGTALITLIMGWYFVANLGGLTGDTYGAINEVLEAAIPIAIILLPGVWRAW